MKVLFFIVRRNVAIYNVSSYHYRGYTQEVTMGQALSRIDSYKCGKNFGHAFWKPLCVPDLCPFHTNSNAGTICIKFDVKVVPPSVDPARSELPLPLSR